MFAIKFSFVLRYHRDVPRSILVPLEKLVGINLAGSDENVTDAVMAVIEKGEALLKELFGDYAPTYRHRAPRHLLERRHALRRGTDPGAGRCLSR